MKFSIFSKETKTVLSYGMPLAGNQFIGAFMGFVVTLMLAQLGHDVLAASALGIMIYATIALTAFGITNGIGIILGQMIGRKQEDKIGDAVRYALLFSTILGILSIVILLSISPVLYHLGQPPQIIHLVDQFLLALSLSILPQYWNNVLNQYLTVIGHSRIVFRASLINLVVAILFSYGFILGHLGMPKLGIIGIGCAYVIAFLVILIYKLIYLAKPNFKKYQFYCFHLEDKHQLSRMVRLGIPIGVQYGAELFVFTLGGLLIGHFGADALAGMQVSMQVNILAIMVPLGISQATSILIGQSYGQQNYEAIKRFWHSSCFIGIIYSTLILILILSAARLFASYYIHDITPHGQYIQHLAVLFLYVSAFNLLFDCFRNIITGALRGINDAMVPMWISVLLLYFIGLPAGYLIAHFTKLGPVGVSVGYFIAFVLAAIFLQKRFSGKMIKLMAP